MKMGPECLVLSTKVAKSGGAKYERWVVMLWANQETWVKMVVLKMKVEYRCLDIKVG